MKRITKNTMKNATARKYFLHASDTDQTGMPACYFSENGHDEGWGFWVDGNGEITTDEHSASGEMPNDRIIAACVRAAVSALQNE